MKLKLAFVALFLLSASLPAMADSLTFTFSNANQSVAAGGTVTFTATSLAPGLNAGDVYLNFDAFNGAAAAYADDSDFFNTYALSLAAGTSFTGDVFTITLPGFATPGQVFNGTFTLQGGADNNAGDILYTQNFSVTTLGPGSMVTPEPSSLILLGTGLIGLSGVMRKRRAFAMGSGGAALSSAKVIEALTDMMVIKGSPEHLRSDNGPEFLPMSEMFQRYLNCCNATHACDTSGHRA